MGNHLKKDYVIDDEPCGSGGLSLRWKLYNAQDKKSKDLCTIFLLDKKALPSHLKNKNTIEEYLNLYRKAVDRGLKFKHPHILKVLKPPIESRNEIAFVTERIYASLDNLLQNNENMSMSNSNENITDDVPSDTTLKNFKFSEVQMKFAISQLCDAVSFLHNEAHMVHAYISPKNVYFTANGDWKLFGFYFSQHISSLTEELSVSDWDFTHEKRLEFYPDFECLAPELLISNILTTKSDVFSIARLIYLIIRNQNGIRRETPMVNEQMYRTFISNIQFNRLPFSTLPSVLVQILQHCFQIDFKLRSTLKEFENCRYLNDTTVKAIRYLDKILETDPKGRKSFLQLLSKKLIVYKSDGDGNEPEIESQMFDGLTLVNKVIPSLVLQLQTNDDRFTYDVISCLLSISDVLSMDDYQSLVHPILSTYFVSVEPPPIFHLILEKLHMICIKMHEKQRKEEIVCMLCKGLSVRISGIQISCLKQIKRLTELKLINWHCLRHDILPKIVDICTLKVIIQNSPQSAAVLSLRVNALMCLRYIFDKFSADVIQSIILETLWKTIEQSKESAILMCVLGVCQAIGVKCSPFMIANHILPHLIPLCMESQLKAHQYQKYMQVICRLLVRVHEHKYALYSDPQNLNYCPQSADVVQNMGQMLGKTLGKVVGHKILGIKDEKKNENESGIQNQSSFTRKAPPENPFEINSNSQSPVLIRNSSGSFSSKPIKNEEKISSRRRMKENENKDNSMSNDNSMIFRGMADENTSLNVNSNQSVFNTARVSTVEKSSFISMEPQSKPVSVQSPVKNEYPVNANDTAFSSFSFMNNDSKAKNERNSQTISSSSAYKAPTMFENKKPMFNSPSNVNKSNYNHSSIQSTVNSNDMQSKFNSSPNPNDLFGLKNERMERNVNNEKPMNMFGSPNISRKTGILKNMQSQFGGQNNDPFAQLSQKSSSFGFMNASGESNLKKSSIPGEQTFQGFGDVSDVSNSLFSSAQNQKQSGKISSNVTTADQTKEDPFAQLFA